ncbi:hypothetical protein SAMN04487820_10665 [Actinopolyspora mzabensis]|uniref:Uncharacterized protein n=1 Tax=Actinopolyspora mzabensis TaxID=995066 RepID=A0A1G9AI42_ACTMZ|nr:hypothetical protein SAMN04487820_10665 [Actinopolyspora mzabensis]
MAADRRHDTPMATPQVGQRMFGLLGHGDVVHPDHRRRAIASQRLRTAFVPQSGDTHETRAERHLPGDVETGTANPLDYRRGPTVEA